MKFYVWQSLRAGIFSGWLVTSNWSSSSPTHISHLPQHLPGHHLALHISYLLQHPPGQHPARHIYPTYSSIHLVIIWPYTYILLTPASTCWPYTYIPLTPASTWSSSGPTHISYLLQHPPGHHLALHIYLTYSSIHLVIIWPNTYIPLTSASTWSSSGPTHISYLLQHPPGHHLALHIYLTYSSIHLVIIWPYTYIRLTPASTWSSSGPTHISDLLQHPPGHHLALHIYPTYSSIHLVIIWPLGLVLLGYRYDVISHVLVWPPVLFEVFWCKAATFGLWMVLDRLARRTLQRQLEIHYCAHQRTLQQ